MSQQTINVGTANNDGTGDPLRVAMTKIQNNFSEIYGNFSTNGTISLASTSANVANVQISNSGVVVSSNSTVNSTSNSTVIRVANSTYSADLSSGGLNVGANVIINATAVFVGNSTIYSNVGSTSRFTGAVTVANTLTVNGQATLANSRFITGSLELNDAGTGDRNALIDFHSDDTYTGFSFRMLASAGANGLRQITTRGTGNFQLQTQEAANIVFSTTSTEVARITAGGNVGIGNTAPNAKLHVTGTANISGAVVLSNTLAVTGIATFSGNVGVGCTSPTVIMTVSANAGAASAVFAGGNTFLRLNSNGSFSEPAMEFGEGALSPTAKIASKNEGNGGGSLYFITRDTSATNSTLSTRLVIDGNGNTGIGNTAPNAKLQVTGTANISGAVTLSTSLTVSTNTLTLGSSNVGAANFANGYARLPNGLLMQFGQLLVNTSTAAQTFSVVTGVAFTNVFSMTATTNTLASVVALTALSATAFTIVSNTAANVAVYWTAIGK